MNDNPDLQDGDHGEPDHAENREQFGSFNDGPSPEAEDIDDGSQSEWHGPLDSAVVANPESTSPLDTAQYEDTEPAVRSTPLVREEDRAGDTTDEWDRSWSAARLGHELKELEAEIKELLESRDPRRKRRFSGTRRWWELEEDLVQLHYSDRYDEPTIARIRQLVVRRHSLFRRLRFLASTRPTWNS